MTVNLSKMTLMPWGTLVSMMMLLVNVRCTIPKDNYIAYTYPGFHSNTEIYLLRGDIQTIAKNQNRPISLSFSGGNIEIEAVDMDIANGGMYVFDSYSRCIFYFVFINNPSGSVYSKHCGISTATDVSIAYDWVSMNIYWTDPYFGWIAVQPVKTTDKSMFRIIVQEKNYKPGALAVDPIKGYLFWFDPFSNGERIERSLLSGENRTVILTTASQCVEDIVADVTSQRLYWVDPCREAIESIDYEGNNRRIVYRRGNAYFHDLAIDKTHICSTLPYDFKLLCVKKDTGSLTLERNHFSPPQAISIYNLNKQPSKTDLCSTKKCEHFCVNNPDGPQCICKEGYSLKDDQLACKADHGLFGKSILVANLTSICMMDFRALTGHYDGVECFIIGLDGVKQLAADTDDHLVFYAEQSKKTINSYDTITGTKISLYSADKVSGLAYDWIDKNLYWCESDTKMIRVISIRTRSSEVIHTAIDSPSFITIDPHNRKLFWIERSSSTHYIISSSLDGKNRKSIKKRNSKHDLKGLNFNVKDNSLYFLENDVLRRSKTDGSDQTTITYAMSSELLVIYKNYAVWSHSSSELTSESFETGLQENVYLKDFGTVTALGVFDPALQPKEKGPCDNLNGGCQQICIANGTGRVCRCNFGFYLDNNGTGCKSDVQQDNFMLVSDTNQRKIYQIGLEDGKVAALDIPSMGSPLSVVYDKRTGNVIWSESMGNIRRANLDGTNVIEILKEGFFSFSSVISIDDTNGFLYYVSTSLFGTTSIMVMDPVSTYKKTLKKRLPEVLELTVHPSKGYIFYVQYRPRRRRKNDKYEIKRMFMNGENDKEIIETSKKINGLTIDFTEDRLYWTEDGNVVSTTLSGSDKKTAIDEKFDIKRIKISNSFLYYSAVSIWKVHKYDLKASSLNNFMKDEPEIGIINSIDVYDNSSRSINTLCKANRQGCSTFCLPTDTSYACACQNGVDLKSDGKTCSGVNKCSGNIKNGVWKNDCNYFQYQFCSFTCDKGFESTLSTARVMCKKDGSWQHDLSSLCKVPVTTTTPKPTTTTTKPTTTTTKPTTTTTKPTTTTTKPTTTTTKPTTTTTTATTTTTTPTTTTTTPTTTTTTPTTTTTTPTTTTTTPTTTTTTPTTTTTTQKPTTTTTTLKPTTTTTTQKPTTTTTTTTPKPTATSPKPTTTTPKPTTTKTTPKPTTTTTTTTPKPTTTTTTTTPKPTTTTTTTTPKPTTTTPKPTTTTTTPKLTTATLKPTTSTTPMPTTMPTTTIVTSTGTNVLCHNSVLHGKIQNTCSRKPGAVCRFTCNSHYERITVGESITCTVSGKWSEDTTKLCRKSQVCASTVLHGKLQDTCTRKPGAICTFVCNNGYRRTVSSNNIACTLSGQWSRDTNKLCQTSRAVAMPNTSAQTEDSAPLYAGIGGGVSAVVIIVVIVILVLLYLKRRRSRDKPRIHMNSQEGFENPSYSAVHYGREQVDNEYDGGYANLVYAAMHGSQSSRGRSIGKNDSLSSAATASSFGDKKQMRDSTYIPAPNDHIHSSDAHIYASIGPEAGIHGRKNSNRHDDNSRRGSKKDSSDHKKREKRASHKEDSKDRKHSHRRPGGVGTLQDLYTPPAYNRAYDPYFYNSGEYMYPTPSVWNPPGQAPRRHSLQYDNQDAISMGSDYSYRRDSTSRIIPKKKK